MNKMEDKAYNLIEEMALKNFQRSTERVQPKRVRGKLEADALTLLSAKVDTMTQRLDCMNVNVVNSSTPPPCEICGSVDHLTLIVKLGVLLPRTLMKSIMSIASIRGLPMTHIPILITRVGGTIPISLISLT